MKRAILFFLVCGMATFAFHLATSAQDKAPAPDEFPQETARIDQLLKDNRTFMSEGRFNEIFPKAEEALALSQQIGDKPRQARSIMQIATASYHTGRTDIATEKFKLAASIAEDSGDSNLQSLSLNSATALLTTAGAYEEALNFSTKSLALRRRLKDRRGEAYVLAQMSPLYRDTGDLATGDRLLQDALNITRELKASGKGDAALEEYILQRIAYGEYLYGNPAAALTAYQNAIASETARTSGANKVEARQFLGYIYISMRDWEKASEVFQQMAELSRTFKSVQGESIALGYLGWSQFHLGRPKEAAVLLSQAIALSRQTGERLSDSRFMGFLAEVQRALGQPDAAETSYREAVALVERDRSRTIPTEASKGNVVSRNHQIFSGAIDTLFSMSRQAEAFEIAEAYHARAFLDVLVESRIDVRKELSPAQKQQEGVVFDRLASIQKELWTPALSKEREEQLRKDLQHAEQQLEALKLELRRAIPRYASVKYPQTLNPDRITEEVLDENTALIEFVLGEKKSFAWVIYRGKVSSVTLAPREEVEALIKEYRVALSERVPPVSANAAIARVNRKSRELYLKLLAPMEAHLSTVRKLIIVPDGSLLYLPFETLARERKVPANQGGLEYLIERFAISYAPSATALAVIKGMNKESSRGSKGIIAFGDPVYAKRTVDPVDPTRSRTILDYQAERGFVFNQLPYTRNEVNNIASLFSTNERRTFLGAEANEGKVKGEDLSQYRYLHLAAHGMIDEEFPARSGIVLSVPSHSNDDGVLQVSEVMRLKLNADLVTLSACRSGLGKLLNGEGMIGLTRAFHYAGANSVVVSLWNVNDIATAELMKNFYSNLRRGMPKDEALRQSKLSLLKGKHQLWRHPYFWAPFVLVGANN